MIPKATGIVVGILVMYFYFRLIGTLPVMQTLVGLLLGLVTGLAVWAAIDRWQIVRKGRRP